MSYISPTMPNYTGFPSPTSTSVIPPSPSKGGGIISTVTGGNPLGFALGVLDTLDIKENLALVKQYGLKAWGSSTNPTKELADMQGHVIPIIEQTLSSVTDDNVGEKLTFIDGFVMWTIEGYNYLLRHHTKSPATRDAYNQTIKKLREIRIGFVENYANGLGSNGATVTKQEVTETFHNLENKYPWHTGDAFGTRSRPNVTYYSYSVKTPSVLEKIINPTSGTQTLTEKSNIKLLGGGLLVPILVIGGLLTWIVKKIKGNTLSR